MRVLAITRIFPNSLEPLSSPFNRQQFAALSKLCELDVLEAIPSVPLLSRFGVPARAARLRGLPAREDIDGIPTHYMRALYVPRIGLGVAAPLYVASALPHVRLVREADVVLGAWAYPDGASAVALARAFRKPCVVKVHGSDVNVIAQRLGARMWLERLLPHVTLAVAVSRPLMRALEELGVPRDRIRYVPNGVDTSLFRPRDRNEARAARGVSGEGPIVLFVGRLERAKGIVELIAAMESIRAERPDVRFVLLGDGETGARVRELAAASNGGIIAPGPRPLTEVAEWLGACDVFCLPSHREGTPNVVLEALASGRPVVATRVGGIPDIVDDSVGRLVPAQDANALTAALRDALSRSWDPVHVASKGPRSWAESGKALYGVIEEALSLSQ